MGSEKRLHLIRDFPSLMGLQRDDDVILMAELSGIVRGGHPGGLFFAADNELQSIGTYGCKMSTARNEGDVGARELHQHADVAADRSRSINANLHCFLFPGSFLT